MLRSLQPAEHKTYLYDLTKMFGSLTLVSIFPWRHRHKISLLFKTFKVSTKKKDLARKQSGHYLDYIVAIFKVSF